MSKLRDLQCGLGRAILGKDEASIVSAIMGDGLDPAARLNIYRNHYNSSLSEALKAIYPVVCRLVGERFFAYATSEYIKASPPRRVCLFEYGESFPDFLAAFPACASLVYLPDVARLEWLINAALHAPAPAPIEASELGHLDSADYPRLVLAFQPSLRLIESDWPIDRIWHLNRPDALEAGAVDLAVGGCRLEIRQVGEDVVFRPLESGTFALRATLAKGQTLEAAIEAALAQDPIFDTALALRRLFGEGLVIGFTLAPPPNPAQS
jgi:putative DNA-binding protein